MKECRIIRGGDAEGYAGKQGLDYFAGVSAESCGSEGLCLHLLIIPPGGDAPQAGARSEPRVRVVTEPGSTAAAPG